MLFVQAITAQLALCAIASDVISDLVTPEADKSEALRLRQTQFWSALSSVADDMRLTQHAELYQETEKALAELDDNTYSEVKAALSESLQHLKQADAAVLQQGLESSEFFKEELSSDAESRGLSWFAQGGQNVLAKAIRLFAEGGDYTERLKEQVRQRQKSLMPALEAAAHSSADVLTDTRLGSKRAFDVLKYDIYTKGAPKTPESAKTAANKLVNAVAETRHRFMTFVTGMATSLAHDVQGTKVSASATVAMDQLSKLEETPRLAAETKGSVLRAQPVSQQAVEDSFGFLGL